MRGCEWMDGRMDGKVVGRVVGGRWEGSGKMNGRVGWRVDWRVVGDWWEDRGRIMGGVGVAVRLLATGISGTGLYCLREVRSLFELQGALRDSLSSHCRRTQGTSPVTSGKSSLRSSCEGEHGSALES